MSNYSLFSKLRPCVSPKRVRAAARLVVLTAVAFAGALSYGLTAAGAVSLTQYPLPAGPAAETPEFLFAGPTGLLGAAAAPGSAYAPLQPQPGGVKLAAGPAGPRAQRAMTVGADGGLWYVSSTVVAQRSYEAIFEATAAGVATRAVYPSPADAPVDMTLGADGALWLTDAGADAIDRYVPGGEITAYPVPRGPLYLTSGADGAIWFTESWPAIGRVTTSGELSEFPLAPGTGPAEITTGRDGAIWFAAWQAGAIGRMTTGGGLQLFAVPRRGGPANLPTPMALTSGTEGAIWFTDPGDDSIGRVQDGQVSEYPIPALAPSLQLQPGITDATPKAIVAGADGSLWVTEAGARAILRVDPQGAPPATPARRPPAASAARCRAVARAPARPTAQRASRRRSSALRRASARCLRPARRRRDSRRVAR
jgi:virginiamycin B lyase